jgi:hypothetical protein
MHFGHKVLREKFIICEGNFIAFFFFAFLMDILELHDVRTMLYKNEDSLIVL